MELVLDLVSWGFVLVGCFFMLVSAVGILRMPDIYTRLHAAGIADTMGADLILTGLIFQATSVYVAAKLVFILAFLFISSPVSGHAMARAALEGGVKPILADREEG